MKISLAITLALSFLATSAFAQNNSRISNEELRAVDQLALTARQGGPSVEVNLPSGLQGVCGATFFGNLPGDLPGYVCRLNLRSKSMGSLTIRSTEIDHLFHSLRGTRAGGGIQIRLIQNERIALRCLNNESGFVCDVL